MILSTKLTGQKNQLTNEMDRMRLTVANWQVQVQELGIKEDKISDKELLEKSIDKEKIQDILKRLEYFTKSKH